MIRRLLSNPWVWIIIAGLICGLLTWSWQMGLVTTVLFFVSAKLIMWVELAWKIRRNK